MTRLLSALLALGLLAGPAPADSPKPVTAITPHPTALKLRGADDAPQLIVTGTRADGREIDLTGAAAYSVSEPKVVRVAADGRVFPLANGAAEITATVEGKAVRVPVTVEAMEAPLPINFANHVVPVFTKLGCNSGGCHGKIQGQNGFRLSLLGFDPEFDYANLRKEGRGRDQPRSSTSRNGRWWTGTRPRSGGNSASRRRGCAPTRRSSAGRRSTSPGRCRRPPR